MAGVFRVFRQFNFFIATQALDRWRGSARTFGRKFSSNISLVQELNYRLDRALAAIPADGADQPPSPTFLLFCVLHAVWRQGGDGEVGPSGDKANPNFVSASLPTIIA